MRYINEPPKSSQIFNPVSDAQIAETPKFDPVLETKHTQNTRISKTQKMRQIQRTKKPSDESKRVKQRECNAHGGASMAKTR